MEKYYTPLIEELLPDIEITSISTGSKILNNLIRVEESGIYLFVDLEEMYKKSINNYKIKYLDKDDIESLGFEETSTRQYIIDACGDLPYWTHAVIDFRWKDDISIIGKRGQEVGILFRGKIKNKSELKKLLKQLCITK